MIAIYTADIDEEMPHAVAFPALAKQGTSRKALVSACTLYSSWNQ